MLGIAPHQMPPNANVTDEEIEIVDLDEAAADALEAEWEKGDLTPNEYGRRWAAIYGGKEGRYADGRSAGVLADGPEGTIEFDFGVSWVAPSAE